jgi:hypothetical protein
LNDIITNCVNTLEYQSLIKDYNFVKIKGVSVKISPACANNPAINSLPSFYINIVGGAQNGTPSTSYTLASAYYADDSIQYPPANYMRGLSCYWGMPNMLIGQNGYPLGGTMVHIASGSLNSTSGLQLILGYNIAFPPNIDVALLSNASIMVATLDVALDCEFSAPTFSI